MVASEAGKFACTRALHIRVLPFSLAASAAGSPTTAHEYLFASI